MSVLAAGGEAGGARALLPALQKLVEHGVPVSILGHGVLDQESPSPWPRVHADERHWRQALGSGKHKVLLFSTSVHDLLPLQVAREAGLQGIFVVSLLDSWMNYVSRLCLPGGELVIPDIYAVMDGLAAREAVRDGVPREIVRITGHPALASLGDEFRRFQASAGPASATGDRAVVFISEPASVDQGESPADPAFRGYTEHQVLKLLCGWLNRQPAPPALWVAPHPRDDAHRLQNTWEENRGRLDGHFLSPDSGKQAVFAADGVAGMASMLLLEGWLLGKPVLSLQPGLRLEQLRYLDNRPGLHFVDSSAGLPAAAESWLAEVSGPGDRPANEELMEHRKASDNLADIVEDFLSQPGRSTS